MDKFTLPGDLAGQFAEFPGPVEICDDAGFTLGYFQPALKTEPPESPHYALLEAQFSPEELERRRQETGGISTAELLAKLRSL